MKLLENKVCIITGGAGSIGLTAAELFIEHGAKVMLVDLSYDALRAAASRLPANQVAYHAADVGRAADVASYVSATVTRWDAIDVLLSNAGNAGVIAPLQEYPELVFNEVLRVHVNGAFLACKYCAPQMRNGGSIVITSSVAGLRGDPGVYGYITAKHAQVGLMRCVAKELASRNIRVNTIHPGPTRNEFQNGIEHRLSGVLGRNASDFFDDMIPLHRHALPREIAQAMLFLASDQSSFMTGSMLVVDGGMSA